MRFRSVVFDLDDTLIWDERISRQALLETAVEAARALPAVDAARLAGAAKRAADELWHEHAPVERCDALGIVAFEGMWGHFRGEDDYLHHLREWVPTFRSELWRRALAALGADAAGGLPERLGQHFMRRRRELQDPLPGAEEILRRLRTAGVRVGLLTNGAPDLQREKLESSGLAVYLDAVAVSGEVGTGKPEPAIFRHLLGELGAEAADSLMVGNSLARDIVGGKHAGMRTCWLALPGEDEPVGLVAPDYTIRSLGELPPIVLA